MFGDDGNVPGCAYSMEAVKIEKTIFILKEIASLIRARWWAGQNTTKTKVVWSWDPVLGTSWSLPRLHYEHMPSKFRSERVDLLAAENSEELRPCIATLNLGNGELLC